MALEWFTPDNYKNERWADSEHYSDRTYVLVPTEDGWHVLRFSAEYEKRLGQGLSYHEAIRLAQRIDDEAKMLRR